jgi:hypothetical protein
MTDYFALAVALARAAAARVSEQPGPCFGRHWWFYIRPTILKCKRCGLVKYAPAR